MPTSVFRNAMNAGEANSNQNDDGVGQQQHQQNEEDHHRDSDNVNIIVVDDNKNTTIAPTAEVTEIEAGEEEEGEAQLINTAAAPDDIDDELAIALSAVYEAVRAHPSTPSASGGGGGSTIAATNASYLSRLTHTAHHNNKNNNNHHDGSGANSGFGSGFSGAAAPLRDGRSWMELWGGTQMGAKSTPPSSMAVRRNGGGWGDGPLSSSSTDNPSSPPSSCDENNSKEKKSSASSVCRRLWEFFSSPSIGLVMLIVNLVGLVCIATVALVVSEYVYSWAIKEFIEQGVVEGYVRMAHSNIREALSDIRRTVAQLNHMPANTFMSLPTEMSSKERAEFVELATSTTSTTAADAAAMAEGMVAASWKYSVAAMCFTIVPWRDWFASVRFQFTDGSSMYFNGQTVLFSEPTPFVGTDGLRFYNTSNISQYASLAAAGGSASLGRMNFDTIPLARNVSSSSESVVSTPRWGSMNEVTSTWYHDANYFLTVTAPLEGKWIGAVSTRWAIKTTATAVEAAPDGSNRPRLVTYLSLGLSNSTKWIGYANIPINMNTLLDPISRLGGPDGYNWFLIEDGLVLANTWLDREAYGQGLRGGERNIDVFPTVTTITADEEALGCRLVSTAIASANGQKVLACPKTIASLGYQPLIDAYRQSPELFVYNPNIWEAFEGDRWKISTHQFRSGGTSGRFYISVTSVVFETLYDVNWVIATIITEPSLGQRLRAAREIVIGAVVGVTVFIAIMILVTSRLLLSPVHRIARLMTIGAYLLDPHELRDDPDHQRRKPSRLYEVSAIQLAYWTMCDRLQGIKTYIPDHLRRWKIEIPPDEKEEEKQGNGKWSPSERQRSDAAAAAAALMMRNNHYYAASSVVGGVSSNNRINAFTPAASSAGGRAEKDYRRRNADGDTSDGRIVTGSNDNDGSGGDGDYAHGKDVGASDGSMLIVEAFSSPKERNGGGANETEMQKIIVTSPDDILASTTGGGTGEGGGLTTVVATNHTNGGIITPFSCSNNNNASNYCFKPPNSFSHMTPFIGGGGAGNANSPLNGATPSATNGRAFAVTSNSSSPHSLAAAAAASSVENPLSHLPPPIYFSDPCLIDRDITVVHMNIIHFHQYARRKHPQSITADYEKFITFLRTEVRRFGGVLESFVGDKFWVSFNATSKCTYHQVSAAYFAHHVTTIVNSAAVTFMEETYARLHQLKIRASSNSRRNDSGGGNDIPPPAQKPPPVRGDPRFAMCNFGVNCGVATGRAFVGPLGNSAIKRHNIISNAVSEAAALERLGIHYVATNALIGEDLIPYIRDYCQHILVDVTLLPGSRNNRRLIACLKGPMVAHTADPSVVEQWLVKKPRGRFASGGNSTSNDDTSAANDDQMNYFSSPGEGTTHHHRRMLGSHDSDEHYSSGYAYDIQMRHHHTNNQTNSSTTQQQGGTGGSVSVNIPPSTSDSEGRLLSDKPFTDLRRTREEEDDPTRHLPMVPSANPYQFINGCFEAFLEGNYELSRYLVQQSVVESEANLQRTLAKHNRNNNNNNNNNTGANQNNNSSSNSNSNSKVLGGEGGHQTPNATNSQPNPLNNNTTTATTSDPTISSSNPSSVAAASDSATAATTTTSNNKNNSNRFDEVAEQREQHEAITYMAKLMVTLLESETDGTLYQSVLGKVHVVRSNQLVFVAKVKVDNN